MDSLYMTEVGIAGGRVDLMVIDLRTHAVIGYEVKVSRSDFKGDKKWPSYTPYFNRFYFATPPGIVLPGEIPEEIGLVELRGEGTKKHLVQVQKGAELQSRFTRRSLGEAHFINLLLGYMRDFNWRHNSKRGVVCRKCQEWNNLDDPRGVPFGRWAIPEYVEIPPTPAEIKMRECVDAAILGD